MKEFTKEQMDILSKYEKTYNSAMIDNVCKSNDIFALQMLASIYADVSGDGQRFRNLNCPTCVLKLYKILGQLYFEQLNKSSVSTNKNNEVKSKSK